MELTRPPIPAPTIRMSNGCGSAVWGVLVVVPFTGAPEAASWSMNIASLCLGLLTRIFTQMSYVSTIIADVCHLATGLIDVRIPTRLFTGRSCKAGEVGGIVGSSAASAPHVEETGRARIAILLPHPPIIWCIGSMQHRRQVGVVDH